MAVKSLQSEHKRFQIPIVLAFRFKHTQDCIHTRARIQLLVVRGIKTNTWS
jgi:hypothetical protein